MARTILFERSIVLGCPVVLADLLGAERIFAEPLRKNPSPRLQDPPGLQRDALTSDVGPSAIKIVWDVIGKSILGNI